MITSMGLVGFLIIAVMLFLVVRLLTQSSAQETTLSRDDRVELHRLRELVDDLKETAWDHRELDSPLATIIIDKIRTHERRNREPGS